MKDAAKLKVVLGTMLRMQVSLAQVKLIARKPPSEKAGLPNWPVGEIANYANCSIRRINPKSGQRHRHMPSGWVCSWSTRREKE